MILEIPFCKNSRNGKQCMQAAMQCVLKYFLDKDYSLKALDKLTKRRAAFWTSTSQIVPALNDLGLKVRYYSKTDLEPFLEGEPFIRRRFGADADKILKFTDMPVVIEAIKGLIGSGLFKKMILPFREIEEHIRKGNVPLMLIDNNKIMGKKGIYQGHFIVLTGFDKRNVFYHDSGPKRPKANKKISKEAFIEAWNANGTDNDVVIVFGKK